MGTCPESAQHELGLRRGPIAEASESGKFYRFPWSSNPIGDPVVSRPRWGVTNLASEEMSEGTENALIYLCSTHGFYYAYNPTGLYQRRTSNAADAFITAFDEFPRNRGTGRSEIAFAPFDRAADLPRVLHKGYTGFFWQPSWQDMQLNGGVLAGSKSVEKDFLRDGVRDLLFVGDVEQIEGRPENMLVATTQGIFRSTDGGRSWKRVYH